MFIESDRAKNNPNVQCILYAISTASTEDIAEWFEAKSKGTSSSAKFDLGNLDDIFGMFSKSKQQALAHDEARLRTEEEERKEH